MSFVWNLMISLWITGWYCVNTFDRHSQKGRYLKKWFQTLTLEDYFRGERHTCVGAHTHAIIQDDPTSISAFVFLLAKQPIQYYIIMIRNCTHAWSAWLTFKCSWYNEDGPVLFEDYQAIFHRLSPWSTGLSIEHIHFSTCIIWHGLTTRLGISFGSSWKKDCFSKSLWGLDNLQKGISICFYFFTQCWLTVASSQL